MVELVFVLIELVFKLTFTVLRVTTRGVLLLLRAVLRYAKSSRKKEVSEVGAEEVASDKPAETSKPEKVEAARSVSISVASKGPVSAAFTRTITFERGFGAVLFWFYPGGKVRRLVKIYDRTLSERLGFERRELEEVSYSGMSEIEPILKATVAQVNKLLRGEHEVKLRVVASGSSDPTAASGPKAESQDQDSTKRKAGDSSEKSARRSRDEGGDVAVMPSSFKEAVEKKQKRSRPSKVYTGEIVEIGVKPRKIDDKQIEQYCVTIEADELHGNALPVYGTDLERAIADCGAEVGSRVRIEHLGRIEWREPDGRKAWKNAYNVVKL
ncbi:hypothetical protein [Paraburkholderia fungorum]|uniref:Uncharacterized protein n=1 Tax=Paraburkholderia fungorum TaxID=134537 RepID=A0AAW3V2Z9_9BURK|nr:hypothetical protein [Paraburkholderia fungorum]MBB4518680.1 hypothetical protein [Paraburkholderia fungorum]MBB6204165.1 hypothetical protein [Paraburkholderia fungorum]